MTEIYKIVFVLNTGERELRRIQAIQTAIQNIQPHIEVHIIESRHPNLIPKILEIHPQILVTYPFTSISTSYRCYILKYLLNCLVVCYPAEGILGEASPDRVRRATGLEKYGVNLVDYQLFWGRKMAATVGERLLEQKKLSSPQRIYYFGAPFFEEYFRSNHEVNVTLPSEVSSKLALYPREKTVLFVTGFSYADYSPTHILGAGDIVDIYSDMAQKDFEQAQLDASKTKQFRQLWINAIMVSAIHHPDLLFVVKMHPHEIAMYKYRKAELNNPYTVFYQYSNILLISEPLPFRAVVCHCSLLFHYGSTTSLEAYLLKIPSISVVSKSLGRTSLGIPAARTAEVIEVPAIVSTHFNMPLAFERNPAVELFLEEEVNLKMGEDYRPSEKIAHFLLSMLQEAPQFLSPLDEYLANAIQQLGGSVVPKLLETGIAKLNGNDFQGALEPYLDWLWRLMETGAVQIQKIQFLRSVCLFHLGFINEAIFAAEQELSLNPQDEQTQTWHRTLTAQIAENNKAKSHQPPVPKNPVSPQATQLQMEDFDLLLPKIFTIETVLACSLRCPECAIGGNIIERRHAALKFEQFKLIADKIRPFVKYLYLHLWGEPLLNKQIIPMIQYAAQFTRTNISTHAQVLSGDTAEALITSGVSDIIVSIDGVSQAVYEQYRVGGDVKTALSNLAMLQELNLKHGNRVNLMPQFIMFKHNQHEKPLFEEYCHRLGLRPFFKPPYIRLKESKFAYSDFPEYIRPHYPDLASLRQAMQSCNAPRDNFVINVDGSVIVCCHDYNGLTTFGNLFQQSVLEIWDNPKYRQFRYAVMTGNTPEFCLDYCMTYLPGFETRTSKRKIIPIVPGK